jgi:hypothetical protein
MALVLRGKDGGYVTKCAICGEALTEPFFATSHFIGDQSHDLWRFSDACMHWDCYATWPHQQRFADLFFQSRCARAENKYWSLLWKSADVLVTYGIAVDEISVVPRKSASDMRVDRGVWREWLGGNWRKDVEHSLEQQAIQDVIPELEQITIPTR